MQHAVQSTQCRVTAVFIGEYWRPTVPTTAQT